MRGPSAKRALRRAPRAAYDTFDVIDFILGVFNIFNGLLLIINNFIEVVERLFDNTDA